MKRAVIFDLDETLIDRHAGLVRYAERLWASGQTNAPLYAPFLQRFIELDGKGRVKRPAFFAQLCAEFMPHVQAAAVAEAFIATAWIDPPLFEGAASALVELKRRGYAIGIVSNGQSRTQRAKIDNSPLAGLVDLVAISGELGIDKPDPRIFAHAVEALGVPTAGTWFVGDDPHADIRGAAEAGLRSLWIERYLAWPADLPPCYHAKIASLHEVPDLVETQ